MQQYRTHRIAVTERARNLLRQLIEVHGAVLFHQSGGSPDDSSPICLPVREFRIGGADVLLGYLPWHTEFWLSAEQYQMWKHTHVTVDVVDGRGSSVSLEAPRDVRFLLRSRLLTDEELATLPPPRTGADRLI
ncbi:hypothetical protein DFR70_101342 [Nocardia tenerifensis]|uniref:DUF779 domain-containing protein n=1 Tax=Nocardia tenerifensis TaxID=228006 RepID=A0A318K8R8_9NOCA|nr:DUF779 domain-containing protein [Nocardia tenerifensis]PXX70921.1 hypothetical protein DFR70_101342 [Nocardia tenerifensis]